MNNDGDDDDDDDDVDGKFIDKVDRNDVSVNVEQSSKMTVEGNLKKSFYFRQFGGRMEPIQQNQCLLSIHYKACNESTLWPQGRNFGS